MNSLDSDLAKSTKRYLALDPDMEHDGDFAQLIDTPCMVTLTRSPSKKDKDTVYNNVYSVQTMRTKDAARAPALVNGTKVFDVDEPDLEVFLSLPTWMQTKIKENLDYGGSDLEKLLEGHDEGSPDKGSSKGNKASSGKKSKKGNKDNDDEDEDW